MKKGKILLISLFVLCMLSSFTDANALLSDLYYPSRTSYLASGVEFNPLSTSINPLGLGLTGSFYVPPMTTYSYSPITPSFSRMASSTPFGSIYMNPNTPHYTYTPSFGVDFFGTSTAAPAFMGTVASASKSLYGLADGFTTGLGAMPGSLGVDYSRLYSPFSIGGISTIPGLSSSLPYSAGSLYTTPYSSSFGTGGIFAGWGAPGGIGYGTTSGLYTISPSYTSGVYPGSVYSGVSSGGYGWGSGGSGVGYTGSGGYALYGGYGAYTYSGDIGGGSSSLGGGRTFYEGEEGGTGTSVQSGTLTAGDIDDNLNFDSLLSYIDSILQSDSEGIYPSVTIADRVTLRILDPNGNGISNAQVSILPDGGTIPVIETFAGTNGIFYFFPALDGAGSETIFTVQARPPESDTPSVDVELDLNNLPGDRTLDIVLDGAIQLLPDALDLMIVMDATGSMSDELEYITTELEDIIAVIQGKHPDVSMRFGLIVYRDVGDEYVVRSFDFTDSLSVMQQRLSEQHAAGGGDYPEAVEQALAEGVSAQWSGGNTARLMFHVADAPPHDEFIKAAFEEAKIARQIGIRIYSLSASGVAEAAEFLMRSNACITQGRYLFLTDDSGVGNPHAEPSIPCYVVTRLDHLIVRIVDSELAGKRIEPEADEIIREVGTCVSGVCIEEQVEEQ